MTTLKLIAALGLGAIVSACGATDMISRSAPFEARAVQTTPETVGFAETTAPAQTAARAVPSAGPTSANNTLQLPASILDHVNVAQINVTVPQSLRVSEANRYYPLGDIVWREDPIGDRHAQVRRIFETGFQAGAQSLDGPNAVTIDVEVERFHSLTEKARYTVGGVHSIRFRMIVRDATTGEALSEPRVVKADLDAFGGQQALTAEARGLTQKVRITSHLAEVIRQELSRPEGYVNARLGFFQLVNNI